jgi:hypothetical protein
VLAAAFAAAPTPSRAAGEEITIPLRPGVLEDPTLLPPNREAPNREAPKPPRILQGKAGKRTVELLDLDGDGTFDGPHDLIRWAGGAFHEHPASRRLGSAEEIVTYSLVSTSRGPALRVVPEPRPDDASDLEWRGLLAVSAYRNDVGLPPLHLDRARCDACRKHAEYIRLNPVDGFGHDEKEGRPGYSTEGRTAAIEGVMERTEDPAYALARLTRMMLHRTPFLGSEDQPLGVGSTGAPDARPAAQLGTGFTVLWAARALTTDTYPVLVPAPGQRDVPRELLPEVPIPEERPAFYAAPRGYAVSVSFLTSGGEPPKLSLHRAENGKAAEGKTVEGETWSPRRPVHSTFAHNYRTAYFAPLAPLDAMTEYVVDWTAGDGSTLSWRFRTGR